MQDDLINPEQNKTDLVIVQGHMRQHYCYCNNPQSPQGGSVS